MNDTERYLRTIAHELSELNKNMQEMIDIMREKER